MSRIKHTSIVTCLIFVGLLSAAVMVYALCHNSEDCEDPIAAISSFRYWQKPNRNTVKFKCNHNGYNPGNHPSFVSNVLTAAESWTNISWQGNRIAFNLDEDGATTARAGVEDSKNVVGWAGEIPGGGNTWVGFTTWWLYTSTYQYKEVDIFFNYYKDWDQHHHTNASEHCYLNVAAHEFGHFAGLDDAYYDPDEEEDELNCPVYTEYTMYGHTVPNEHKKEALECEDKYALHYTYYH